MESTNPNSFIDARLYGMVLVLLDTSIRRGELASLKLASAQGDIATEKRCADACGLPGHTRRRRDSSSRRLSSAVSQVADWQALCCLGGNCWSERRSQLPRIVLIQIILLHDVDELTGIVWIGRIARFRDLPREFVWIVRVLEGFGISAVLDEEIRVIPE